MGARPLIAAAILALLLSGCAHSGGHGVKTAGAQVSTTPTAPPLTASGARTLSRNLTAGNSGGLRSAIAMPAGQSLAPAAASQLAALGTVTFDQSTFRAVDARDATVVGRIQHPPPGDPATWTFELSYVDGTWKIADAEPRR